MSNKNVSNKVMESIKRGDVKMKPGVYFSILTALTLLAGIAAGAIMSYLSSMFFFWLRIVGAETNAFGARRNLAELLSSFPWWVLLVFVVLLFIVTKVVQNYGHIYRYKLRHIVLAVLVFSLFVGYLLSIFGIGDIHSMRSGQEIYQNSQWRR